MRESTSFCQFGQEQWHAQVRRSLPSWREPATATTVYLQAELISCNINHHTTLSPIFLMSRNMLHRAGGILQLLGPSPGIRGVMCAV